jgi:hypothetical protein
LNVDPLAVVPHRGVARCDGILSYVREIDLGRPPGTWVIVGVQAR